MANAMRDATIDTMIRLDILVPDHRVQLVQVKIGLHDRLGFRKGGRS